MANRNISPDRKTAYYIGMGLTGLGVLLFLSVFVTGCMHFGDFTDFDGRVKSDMARALVGMACIGIGKFLMHMGRSGIAGSGIKLDPQEAREDLEPWSRMSGGMLKDTLDEAGLDLGRLGKEKDSEMPFDEQLRRLESLKNDGLIDETEYRAARKRILDDIG